ncbi:MAG: ABC transporter permease, partial [Clostridia bacterium]|nr:ABC transporter permease [Clostridia bacterium]
IGIAMVLALSSGFSAYINRLQAQTLSVYPLTVSESSIALEDFNKLASSVVTDEQLAQRLTEKVYQDYLFGDLANMLESNDINQVYTTEDGTKIAYLDYVSDFVNSKNAELGENEWKYCLEKDYGFDVNYYIFSEIGLNLTNTGTATYSVMAIDTLVQSLEEIFSSMLKESEMNISTSFVREYIPTISEIPSDINLIKSQYDLLYGDWATSENQLLLVVDEYNQVPDITLAFLGYNTIEGMDGVNVAFGNNTEFTFKSATEKKFWYIPNNDRYMQFGENYIQSVFDKSNLPSTAEELAVKGIVRLKDGLSSGILQEGIAYTSALKNKIMSQENLNSNVVLKAKQNGGKLAVINPLIPTTPVSMTVRELAGDNTVNKLSIYSYDYESKEELKAHLDAWNTNVIRVGDEDAEVHYSDTTDMLFSALNMVVDAVKIILIAFTAISLVVSSIMIGIITYVSVVERTKEIGVLRSLGARKKDVSRIFNAETFLIGLFAGLIGVGVTYLLSIPINLIVGKLIQGGGNIASLGVLQAGVLVVVSFVLTLIAGIFPARIAAKKDPVIALRTE